MKIKTRTLKPPLPPHFAKCGGKGAVDADKILGDLLLLTHRVHNHKDSFRPNSVWMR